MSQERDAKAEKYAQENSKCGGDNQRWCRQDFKAGWDAQEPRIKALEELLRANSTRMNLCGECVATQNRMKALEDMIELMKRMPVEGPRSGATPMGRGRVMEHKDKPRCNECRNRIISRLKEREHLAFTNPSALCTDYPAPTISMPKETLIRFKNDYAEIADALAELLGVATQDLCGAHILWRIERVTYLEHLLVEARARAQKYEKALKRAQYDLISEHGQYMYDINFGYIDAALEGDSEGKE